MRKILSILVVLGLVLSMTVAAAPVSAAVTKATVVPVTNCAGLSAVYTITFNITAELQTGSNHIFIEFPDDTTVPATGWQDGDIEIFVGASWYDVFGLEVEVTGRTVKFMVPVDVPAGEVVVRFNTRAGPPAHAIKNPTVPSAAPLAGYKLNVWTDRPADGTPVASNAYTIAPAASSYKLEIDFGPTYLGICPGFIPPVQASNITAFNLTLAADPVGCAGLPITCEVWLLLKLKNSPATTSKVDVTFEGGPIITLDRTKLYPAVGFKDQVQLWDNMGLANNFSETFEMTIHLYDVSWHDLEFELWSECAVDCGTPTDEAIDILPFPIKSLQWLYVDSIDLFAKWNLVSIPFEPWNSDIDFMLSSFCGLAPLVSVWHYDCDDGWLGYPDQGLTEIVDGKGYWMRFPYGATIPYGTLIGTWWVFGSLESPPTPANYEVCEGWNMIGFTDPTLTGMMDDVYLWNWTNIFGQPTYGMIYGWNAATQTWLTGMPGFYPFVAGAGYWVPFQSDGYIYP